MAKVCVIAGVGPGNGASLCRKFSSEGHTVAMLARNEQYLGGLAEQIPDCLPFPCDVSSPEAINTAFKDIRDKLGQVETLIYNAGSGLWTGVMETTAENLYDSWAINVQGLLLSAQQVIPAMLENEKGSIVVIGATASLRGGAKSTAFASAKAGQRSLAQSMARDLGPKGIHIGYVIIDGIIDLERTRARLPDKPDAFFMRASSIADSVYMLTEQERSAWTFELDLRPFGERW